MQDGGYCEELWRNSGFTSKLLYIVFDEGHCIREWNEFREQYKHIGSLRYLIPETIPFYVASATLPTPTLRDVTDILHLRTGHTEEIIRSNDRPEISLCVRKMEHAASSFKDLDFVIPDDFAANVPPPKFVIFCNSILETEAITQYLRNRLPDHLRTKIKYLHATMSADYRADEYMAIKNGDLFGLCVTDAFGMVCECMFMIVMITHCWDRALIWQEFSL